jgi:hypothetical protein
MHPLIAADSLGIPNLWVRISEKTTSRFKFYDYYSAFGMVKAPVDLKPINEKYIIDNYDIPAAAVENIQHRVLNKLETILNVL